MKKNFYYKMNLRRIWGLSKKIFLSNLYRNVVVIIAVVLSTFMLTSVFSVGFSYIETAQLQQIRAMGTTAHVAINNPSDLQVSEIKKSDSIKDIGISQHLGQIDGLEDEDLLLGLNWIDENEWNLHRVPTISDVVGNYPVTENEVMIPTWILERLGITNPQEGMSISLSYHLDDDDSIKTQEFILAGYYTDYSQVRTNDKGSIYVSEEFKNKAAISTGKVVMVSFEDTGDIQKECDRLKDKVKFSSTQSFEIVPVTQVNSQVLIIGIVFILLFIFISGYLLIHNVLYISIVRDIRFFGQLRLIGFTKKEVRKIVYQQVLYITVIGIPIGLILGAAVSFGIVPYSLNVLYSGNEDLGLQISFSPFVFIGATIFSFVTARIGCVKPAKIAAQVSPIAAMSYNDVDSKKLYKRRNKVFRLTRMAFQNIFRSKKSAILVISSLFLGLALYWIATSLLSSISPENFIQQWGESDFAITYSIHDDGSPITADMLEDIKNISGIQNLRVTYVAKERVTFDVQYDEEVFGAYVDSLEGKAGIDFSSSEKRESYTENFYSGVYGIDNSYIEELNKTLEHPIDLEAFQDGKIVVLQTITNEDGENLIQPNQIITIKTKGTETEFEVADGFFSADFQGGRGNEKGTAPDLYISKTALEGLTSQIKIFRIAFDTDGKHDDEVLMQLQTIASLNSDIQIISRIEKAKEMEGYILTTKVLTIGLSFIFLLVGILNFVTTMITSVNNRKQEFAILESIGMTHRQQLKILLIEGFYYWIISFILLLIVGNGIYIPLYFWFKQIVSYASFKMPYASLLIVLIIIFMVCLVTPFFAYQSILKDRLIERINKQ